MKKLNFFKNIFKKTAQTRASDNGGEWRYIVDCHGKWARIHTPLKIMTERNPLTPPISLFLFPFLFWNSHP